MYYVDRYLGELVKEEEKETYAPPERYYEYRKGLDGIIKETYIVSYNPLKLIDFSYTVEEDRKLVSIHRNNHFEEHGVDEKTVLLYAYTVPPEWYEQEVSKYDGNERM